MKRTIFLSLLAGGMLFAASPKKLSGNERVALESSSPRVHLATKHHPEGDKSGRTDRVQIGKSTIVAFVPVGK
jgi:hypothetical protein